MGVLNELVNYQVKVEGGDKASNFKINCLYFFKKYRKSDKFVERIPVAKIRTGGFYFLHYLKGIQVTKEYQRVPRIR